MRTSTIKLITALSALAVLAVAALVVTITKDSTNTSTGNSAGTVPAGASSSGGNNPAVTGQEPKVPGSDVYNGSQVLHAVCTLTKTGWNLAIGNPNGYPVNLDWVQVDFYIGSKNTGSQNAQTNVPVNLAPGQINNSATTAQASFGGGIVPDAAYANMPGAGTPRLTSCVATQWGNGANNG